MRVAQRNRLAMISPNQTGGWCITYPGMEPKRIQAILDQFHAAHNIPTVHKVAVGVISKSWVTLVGPASSLRRLNDFSDVLRKAPQVPADAGVPAHAPFMAGVDADQVLGHSPLLDRPLDWAKVVMVTPSGDCQPRKFDSLRSLLCDIFDDILMRPLLVDKTIESSISQLHRSGSVSIHEVGSTTHMPLVLKTLASAGISYDVVPPYQPPPLGTTPTRGISDRVAVVGMSGRFPGSDNVDEFWDELMGGACHIKKIPKSRYDVDKYYDADQKLKNSTAIKDGAWLNNPGYFDNRFFNVSPREATQMDPVQRLCLTTTHEALEMAGYAPDASPAMNPDRVATYIGVTGYDWLETLHQQGNDIYYVTGAAKAFVSGKINYHYKFGRGAYTLDSVCASSTTALTLACKGLLARDCDMAVAGGGSVFSAPFDFSGVGRSGMISLDGGCRTFHDDADGYARGEGVGMVVLKRLEDAVADKDNILGVISGSARMYSTESTSITHPSHVSQEKTYREVLGQTALDPEEVVYVEMHGTGTQAGDFEELTSVLNVMGGQRLADNPLVVGAVKAAMGHGEGVAGVTALIKTLMMLKHRKIPAQPGYPFKLNHRFPRLDKRNVHIALQHRELLPSPKAADGKIKMIVNTFDASGGNCSLVVEEAPDVDYGPAAAAREDMRPSHVVALSARCASSLQDNCRSLLGYLQENPNTNLANLAYTTTARRMHLALRKAFVCSSVEDLKQQLSQYAEDSANSSVSMKKPLVPKVAFLFTGQGSQYEAMGLNCYKTCTRFRELMQTYQHVASLHGLPEFLPIITGDLDVSRASPAQIQLALVALELAQAETLRTWGIMPDVVVGHSLGEYAALCMAGVLSPSDVLYLVGHRALLMEKRLTPNTHAMLAVPMSARELQAVVDAAKKLPSMLSCAIACSNTPNAAVASGSVEDVTALQEKLAADNVRSTLLRVPFGFHSAQVEPILEEFRQIAAGITFKKPIVPVASTLTGKLVDKEGVFNADYLVRQAREPVNFVDALRSADAVSKASLLWIEVGPDPVCLNMVRKTLDVEPGSLLAALHSRKDSCETAAGILKTAYENGLSVSWKAYYGGLSKSLSLLSDLPAYSWDYKDYWTPYTLPPTWEIEEALATATNKSNNAAAVEPPAASNAFMPTMSLHRLIVEAVDESNGDAKAVFSSNTASPGLSRVISGHVVNGHAIMPLAAFCDMAMTSARHCYTRAEDGAALNATQMTMHNMVITKAITPTADSSPVVLTTATYSRSTQSVDVSFHQACDADKSAPGPLVGTCRITISAEASLSSEQHQIMFLVKTRMQQLRDLAAAGKAHSLLQPVVYRLFGGYVRCSPDYYSMNEVIISDRSQDALASITSPAAANDAAANCVLSPFLYDGVNQLTGFLVNNSLRCSDDQIIHISEGFQESRQFQPLSPGRKYTSYASGRDVDAAGMVIDATSYVFDAETGDLVQLVTGVKFQKMKRAVLDHLLGGSRAAAPSTARDDASSMPTAPRTQKPPTTSAYKPEHKDTYSAPTNAPTVTATLGISDLDSSSDLALIDNLLAVVAAEVGVSAQDMTDETIFGDLGVDSLMAITVLSTIRNELNLDLPPAFFMDYDTVGAAKQALLMQLSDDSDQGTLSSPSPLSSPGKTESPPNGVDTLSLPDLDTKKGDWVQIATPAETPSSIAGLQREPPRPADVDVVAGALKAITSCKITRLQGNEEQQDTRPTTNVFFIADETGSAANYVQLPSLGGGCVYGVDWPADVNVDEPGQVAALAAAMAASITSHDAAGPYVIGGVNFGAILAAEVAKVLGADVRGLLLLDPPTAADHITRTKDRLARMRMLRPAQRKNIDAAAAAFQSYTFDNSGSEALSSIVVAAKPSESETSRWNNWLRGVDVVVVEGAQPGGLMRSPSVSLCIFVLLLIPVS